MFEKDFPGASSTFGLKTELFGLQRTAWSARRNTEQRSSRGVVEVHVNTLIRPAFITLSGRREGGYERNEARRPVEVEIGISWSGL